MDSTTIPNSRSANVVMESQLDWLTFSVAGEQKRERLEVWAIQRAQREAKLGYKAAPFRLMGYEGWSVGRVRMGLRADRALCQLSGDLAEEYATVAVTQADSLTRVDLAVTVRLATPNVDLGREHYAGAVAFHSEHPESALPSIIQDANGGSTCYVGHRTSNWFLRVYNKQAEEASQGDAEAVERYRDCWRYELECKGPVAAAMAHRAVDSTDRHAFCQSAVHEYVSGHGIRPAFLSDGSRVLVSGFRRRSDRATKLAWLTSAVRPAVSWLLEGGDRADIMDALGLPEQGGIDNG